MNNNLLTYDGWYVLDETKRSVPFFYESLNDALIHYFSVIDSNPEYEGVGFGFVDDNNNFNYLVTVDYEPEIDPALHRREYQKFDFGFRYNSYNEDNFTKLQEITRMSDSDLADFRTHISRISVMRHIAYDSKNYEAYELYVDKNLRSDEDVLKNSGLSFSEIIENYINQADSVESRRLISDGISRDRREPFKIIITGDNSFNENNYITAYETLENICNEQIGDLTNVELVLCKQNTYPNGFYAMVEKYAKERNFGVNEMLPLWNIDGSAALYRRNERAVEYADAVVSFHNGSLDTIGQDDNRERDNILEHLLEKSDEAFNRIFMHNYFDNINRDNINSLGALSNDASVDSTRYNSVFGADIDDADYRDDALTPDVFEIENERVLNEEDNDLTDEAIDHEEVIDIKDDLTTNTNNELNLALMPKVELPESWSWEGEVWDTSTSDHVIDFVTLRKKGHGQPGSVYAINMGRFNSEKFYYYDYKSDIDNVTTIDFPEDIVKLWYAENKNTQIFMDYIESTHIDKIREIDNVLIAIEPVLIAAEQEHIRLHEIGFVNENLERGDLVPNETPGELAAKLEYFFNHAEEHGFGFTTLPWENPTAKLIEDRLLNDPSPLIETLDLIYNSEVEYIGGVPAAEADAFKVRIEQLIAREKIDSKEQKYLFGYNKVDFIDRMDDLYNAKFDKEEPEVEAAYNEILDLFRDGEEYNRGFSNEDEKFLSFKSFAYEYFDRNANEINYNEIKSWFDEIFSDETNSNFHFKEFGSAVDVDIDELENVTYYRGGFKGVYLTVWHHGLLELGKYGEARNERNVIDIGEAAFSSHIEINFPNFKEAYNAVLNAGGSIFMNPDYANIFDESNGTKNNRLMSEEEFLDAWAKKDPENEGAYTLDEVSLEYNKYLQSNGEYNPLGEKLPPIERENIKDNIQNEYEAAILNLDSRTDLSEDEKLEMLGDIINEAVEKSGQKYKIIIVGSRDFNNYKLFKETCDKQLEGLVNNFGIHGVEIVSGGSRGPDKFAERYAKENGYTFKEFPADWKNDGKAAGYRRNERMAAYGNALIAFWDGESKGTKHMLERSIKNNLDVTTVELQRVIVKNAQNGTERKDWEVKNVSSFDTIETSNKKSPVSFYIDYLKNYKKENHLDLVHPRDKSNAIESKAISDNKAYENVDIQRKEPLLFNKTKVNNIIKYAGDIYVRNSKDFVVTERKIAEVMSVFKDNPEVEKIAKEIYEKNLQRLENVSSIPKPLTGLREAQSRTDQISNNSAIQKACKETRQMSSELTAAKSKLNETLKKYYTPEYNAFKEDRKSFIDNSLSSSNLNSFQKNYLEKSDYVFNNLSLLLNQNTGNFINECVARANNLEKAASLNSTFVEVNYCDQVFAEPTLEKGDLYHPKMVDKKLKEAEANIINAQNKAAEKGEHFGYSSCSVTVFTPSKDGKTLDSVTMEIPLGTCEPDKIKGLAERIQDLKGNNPIKENILNNVKGSLSDRSYARKIYAINGERYSKIECVSTVVETALENDIAAGERSFEKAVPYQGKEEISKCGNGEIDDVPF